MQSPAPKLSKVHFNILNLKNKTLSDFLYFPLYFQRALWDSKQRRKTMKIHKYHEYTIYPEISPPHTVWMKNKKNVDTLLDI